MSVSLICPDCIDALEILVVDDGGTDETMSIVQEYEKKYPNSVFGIHKENGGYGSVINTSIRRATGKYFKQLDGDDWFETENLPEFIELLRSIDVDYVFIENVPQFFSMYYPYKGEVHTLEEILDDKYSEKYNIIAGVYNAADYGVPQRRKRAIKALKETE